MDSRCSPSLEVDHHPFQVDQQVPPHPHPYIQTSLHLTTRQHSPNNSLFPLARLQRVNSPLINPLKFSTSFQQPLNSSSVPV